MFRMLFAGLSAKKNLLIGIFIMTLIGANIATGYLLKNSWKDNAMLTDEVKEKKKEIQKKTKQINNERAVGSSLQESYIVVEDKFDTIEDEIEEAVKYEDTDDLSDDAIRSILCAHGMGKPRLCE